MSTMSRASMVLVVAAVLAGLTMPAPLMAQEPVQARLRTADAAYAAGDRERAEHEYAEIIALDPSQSRAVFRLAQLRERRQPREAVALYKRYVVLEPRDAWGYIALGNALGATGDVQGGLAAYDAAARLEPGERDVQLGRARLLAKAGHTDAAIAAYERFLAAHPRDPEAWGELAAEQRRAGRHDRSLPALQRRLGLEVSTNGRAAVGVDIGRARGAMRASVEPFAAGSRDSDGLTTMRIGLSATGPLVGGVRVTGTVSAARADDAVITRAAQHAAAGLEYRPAAQLRLELSGGVQRADRTFIDTAATTVPSRGPGSPRAPVGRAPGAGAGSHEVFRVGRGRLEWRKPGNGFVADARLSRQLIDASPSLLAQGVQRDEAALALDLRLRGPLRARAFGRLGSIHNEVESNGRRVLGGALAWAPGTFELSVRGQSMTYAQPTTLAYFAPREVRGAELTMYTERETTGGATFAIDLGAGGQQVADWTTGVGSWAPAFRGWAQLLLPLDASRALGAEVEAYDSSISMDTPTAIDTGSRWRYGSARVWLRLAF